MTLRVPVVKARSAGLRKLATRKLFDEALTVLKGRANYLCLRRWQLLLQSGDLGAADRTLLIKTLFWLPQTRTGDKAELQLSPAEDEAWLREAAQS